MRRWLTIFLLFVLPVQFAWAAAAAYCQHEQVPTKTHMGHHAHEHGATGDIGSKVSGAHLGDNSESKSIKLAGDNDCGFCHLSVAMPLVPDALKLDTTSVFVVNIASNQAFRSRGPDLLERPNWRIA